MRVKQKWFVASAVAIALSDLVLLGGAAHAADLTRYISPDFCAAIVIHPERISESTLAAAIKSVLPKELTTGNPLAATEAAAKQNQQKLPSSVEMAISVDKLVEPLKGKPVRRIVVFIDSTHTHGMAGFASIVQFSADIDCESVLSKYSTDQQAAEAGGVKYARYGQGEPSAMLAPDSRTIINGMERTVVKMLAKNEGDRPLLKQLQKAGLKHDILIEVCAEPLWAGLAKSGQTQEQLLGALGNPAMASMVKDVKSVSLQLDLSGDTLLHAEVACGIPGTAAMLAVMGQQELASAKEQFEALKKSPPPLAPAPLVQVLSKLGDEALAGVKIKSADTTATIDLPVPDSLPEALKAAVKMFATMVPQPAAGK